MPRTVQLIKRRDKARAQLKRVLEPAELLVNQFDEQQDKEIAYQNIRVQQVTIQRKLEDLIIANKAITDIVDVDSQEFDETESYEIDVSHRCTRIKLFLEERNTSTTRRGQETQREPVSQNPVSQNAVSQPSNQPESRRQKSIQLPQLKIPTFYGDSLQWTSFIDSFNAAIHDDAQIPPIQKFSYLRSFTDGEARRLIDGLPITQANYSVAYDLLSKRYGQPQDIINAHMRALWNRPTPENNPASLRHFHDDIETNLRALKALGRDDQNFGELLIPMLLDKLPVDFQRQLTRAKGQNAWTLTSLSETMINEISVLSVGNDPAMFQPDTYQPTAVAFRTQVNQTPATNDERQSTNAQNLSAFHGSTQRRFPKRSASRYPPTKNYPKHCAFCDGTHKSVNCTTHTTYKDRMDIAKRNSLCYNCLGKHAVRVCRSRFTCRQCQGKHHTALHTDSNNNSTSESKSSEANSASKSSEANVHFSHITRNTETPSHASTTEPKPGRALLKTAKVPASYNGNTVLATVLFDEGADRSFVTQRFANKLHATAQTTEILNVKAFGNPRTGYKTIPRTTLQLHKLDGTTAPIDLLYVEEISDNLANNVTTDILQLPYIRDLKLAHPVSNERTITIDILIGVDRYWDFVGDHIIRGSGPTAVSSPFGYLLSGTTHTGEVRSTRVQTFHVTALSPDQLDTNVTSYWDLEAIGIRDTITTSTELSDNHEQYKQYTENCLSQQDGRFIAKLPWIENHNPLPTNYASAEKRTRNMIYKLPNDIIGIYDNVIREQLNRGFIEEVTNDNTSIGHYLPHRPVKRDSKTTPIRVVYDCSATAGNGQPSLNDCLFTGPPLLNNLTSILLRFRSNPIALTADIEKAFLQIRLDEDDRKYTKFLWLSDSNDVDSQFKTYQFSSVLFGATCSPFILNAAIKTLTDDNIDIPAARNLQENIYVDDVITGCQNTKEAAQFYKESTDLLATRHFNLRSWNTNDPELRNIIIDDNRASSSTRVGILGMIWNSETDQLNVKSLKTPVFGPLTSKRDVVSYVASLYDPLGLFAPVGIRAKLLIQQLWKSNHNWDMPISTELLLEWTKIANDLFQVTDLDINRRYFTDTDINNIEIHAFSDASDKAYGGVIYITSEDGQTALVIAKSKVAPIKKQTLTLPRLELMGAVIATRLSQFVSNALTGKYNITKRLLWSDSQIVLHWLNNRGKQDIFTRNRVNEINKSQQEYKYVPTDQNPADLLTRGISPDELRDSQLWWKGPKWLCDYESWPKCELFDVNTQDDISVNRIVIETNQEPVKPIYTHTEQLVADRDTVDTTNVTERNNIDTENKSVGLHQIIDVSAYNDVHRLMLVTAYVLRFVDRLKKRVACNDKPPLSLTNNRPIPTTAEIINAETVWIRTIQHAEYESIITGLRRNNNKIGPLSKQLKLFLDENKLLRTGGRLQNSKLDYDTIHPILLPGHHPFTTMIINATHLRLNHAGTLATTTALRERYWIPSIRRIVNSVLHQCVTCKRVDGHPYCKPIPAPLPDYRVRQAPPFSTCGIDYTGALFVRNPHSNNVTKTYICLFTCAITRAIHLELVPDLTATTFMLAFRRFAARRSTPAMLITDNATTFISASNELKEIAEKPEIQSFLSKNHTTWRFIPKRSPWFGGLYERMVGITKNALKKVLGKACVTYYELETILTEIECSINDRPLTYVSTSVDDLIPLTPSHLVHGRTITGLPRVAPDDVSDIPSNHLMLNRRYQYLSSLQRTFWNRWSAEYLTALRERHLIDTKGTTNNTVNVGDIVLIHDDVKKRINWRLARITRLLPGKDGIVRVVELKTQHGMTNRAITKLYPLELNAGIPTNTPPVNKGDIPEGHVSDSTSNSSNSTSPPVQANPDHANSPRRQRNRRKAALSANKRINRLIKNNLV